MAKCPQCSAELPAEAPEGLCPACLLRQAIDPSAGDTADFGPNAATAFVAGTAVEPPISDADLSALLPQLDQFQLIGQGGMGVVYKARQKNLDRFVAVKIMSRRFAGDPTFAERFSREARSLARLNHPNIVGIYDFGTVRHAGIERCYFTMEYVQGSNLRPLLKQLSPAQALAIIPQICEALQYAHDAGIVHRDIKPENILIDEKGRVKIVDFGLAKLLQQARSPMDYTLTSPDGAMGTPSYMAPEQIERPAHVDHRADVYSLGVVFYEMLTGQLPLGRFDLPSQRVRIDVRLDEVVLKAMEREPDRRYQHASEIKTSVEQIGETAREMPPPPPQHMLAKEPVRLSGMAVTAAVLVMVGFVMMALMAALILY